MNRLAAHALKRAAQRDGGFTRQRLIDGSFAPIDQSESGWSVALAHAESRGPISATAILDYVERHAAELGNGVYLGGWVDGAELVLDLVQIIPDRETAEDIGRLGAQDAIFNLVTGETIYL